MNGSRGWALGLALAAAPAHGEVLSLAGPDEWISRHVPSGEVINPTISDDGRYIAAETEHPDVSFARVVQVFDRQNLAAPERVGTDCLFDLDCEQERPRISGNGRFVIFDSREPYAAGDDALQSDSDVFVWDRNTQASSRVSLGIGGAEPNDESFAADISRDGRYVVFKSYATNLVASPALSQRKLRTYWKDRQTATTKLVSEGAGTFDVEHANARITPNGRYVVAGVYQGNDSYALNWDALTATSGYRIPDYWAAGWATTFAMTQDRRYVAGVASPETSTGAAQLSRVESQQSATVVLVSESGNYAGGVDLSNGANWMATHALPAENLGQQHRVSFYARGGEARQHTRLFDGSDQFGPAIAGFDMTADGRYAVVAAWDQDRSGPDAWDEDNDQLLDVFLIENRLWQPSPTNLVKQFTSVPANSRNVKVSSDGRIGVFESEIPASEFGPYTDGNGTSDVFRYLADFQQIELLSTADGSAAFPNGARNPAMSADGDVVAFEAPDAGIAASNLDDSGKQAAPVAYKAGTASIFLRRLVQNQLQRVSVSRTGGAPNGNSMNPSVSANGRRAAFATDASNINPGSDVNGTRDVVAVDLDSGTRRCVSSCAVAANGASDRPAVSNSGHVAFETAAPTVQKAAGADKATSFPQIVLRSLINGSSQIVSRNAAGQSGNGPSRRASISNNGAVVAYQSSASNLDASGNDSRINVIRTLVGGASQRISRNRGPNGKTDKGVDGDSVEAALSGDGRFLAFQTDASTLVEGDANGVTDLMVYDARSGALQRLSEGYGGLEANGASRTPHLNFNGTRVGFHSFASNLDDASDTQGASATSAPYEAVNPLAASIVFADTFE